MSIRRTPHGAWLVWSAMLAITAVVLVPHRADLDQSHAVLALLLVVLGGSAAGGRVLGFSLACASFALIDYFFQPPFDRLSINKPLDGVVLLAFLAVAGVTTELLARARQEADAAREREHEVASLSRLGAATLRYAKPAEALEAIAALVRETIGAAACAIVPCDDAYDPTPSPFAPSCSDEAREMIATAIRDGKPMLVRDEASGTQLERISVGAAAPVIIIARAVALPLRAEERVIGALVVEGGPTLVLDAPRWRLLSALSYYAALAIERLRLVAEASRSEALREANRAKDRILASISHDLRTPLTTIKVLAQRSEARGDSAATAIVEQADRLERMVGDLLELSRLRVGALAISAELNTADDVVGASLRRAAGIVADRTIRPIVDLESPALVGRFDFVQVLRIIGNLLDNALRFTPPGGEVELSAARDGPWLAFTVADRGIGVATHEQSRIFEAFYRPDGATPDSGHAGLGLSIARTLAELQGGTLEYAARAGGGSEFTLRLPAVDVAVDVAGTADAGLE